MDDLKERLTALGARSSPSNELLDRTLARFDERRRHRRIGGALAGIAAMLVLVGVLAVILTNGEPSVPTFSRYHDPLGWSVDVPPGWTSQPFRFESNSASGEGVQISNVPLPDPKFPPGAVPAADQQALPTDGVSIVVARQVPPSILVDGAVDLPMDFPDGWGEGSVTGELQPNFYENSFRGGQTTFIATVTIGVGASAPDRATLREIVRSIRFDGVATPNPNETVPTSSPAVTVSPAPEPELRREHDPFGWSVGIPAGWKSRQFGFASGSVSAEGIQISSVELPEPGFVPGAPVQSIGNGEQFPLDGVGIVVAKQVDPSIQHGDVVDLPLDYPNGWLAGSAPGGRPTLDTIWFRGGDSIFVATVKTGADASSTDIATVREIVRSIRFEGIPAPNPSDTVTSIGETDIAPGFLPLRAVGSSKSGLTVESPPEVVRWTLSGDTCDVSGHFLQAFGGGGFGGAGCEGDATLSWNGGGSLGGNGEEFMVAAGRVIPSPGIIVRITLQNGDTQTVEPQDGLWMAVIGRCHDYAGTGLASVVALDANGQVLSSIHVDPEQPDPLHPWPPC